MPTFGFSAFLKLISVNVRPRRTTLRGRLLGGGGAYDFHRSFRLRIHRFLVGGESIAELILSADQLGNPHEQKAVRLGLEAFEFWKRTHVGRTFDFPDETFTSPGGRFRVRFTPDFGLEMGGQKVAVHVWNTKTVDLDERMVFIALALFKDQYDLRDDGPDDLALLSLIDGRLYRLNEVRDRRPMARLLAAELDETIRELREELGLPDEPGDHPPP
jgi:hypothetical protein